MAVKPVNTLEPLPKCSHLKMFTFYGNKDALHCVCTCFIPFATFVLIWPIQSMQKSEKMTETLANGYSSESTKYPMNTNTTGFRCFSKYNCFLCFGRK